MSISIPIDSLSDENHLKVTKELRIKMDDKYSFGPATYMIPYTLIDDHIMVPFAYAVGELKLKRRPRTDFPVMDVEFTAELRAEQEVVRAEATNHLNKTGSVIISLYTGAGKTITGIKIATTIKLKTLVVVNTIVLMNQWEESILAVCPTATIQQVRPNSAYEDCDFYIINGENAQKMGEVFFSEIGTMIVDEGHQIMAEMISKCCNIVSPRYLICLTATPYRFDGLDALLGFYFGSNKIIRELHRDHLVYKVTTGFQPTIEFSKSGCVNWGVILDSQSKDPDRNQLIVDIIHHFQDRTFLVLVKRVAQGKLLLKMLNELGNTTTSLLGANQVFDPDARILVGHCNKVGTGFNHPKIDTLMLATDVEQYFIQYLGRCMRKPDHLPIVFDIVDDYKVLTKHYNTRKKVYLKHGGRIENFDVGIL